MLVGAVCAAGWIAGAPTAHGQTEFPTDDKGFVDTAAYCQGSAVAVAVGRTDSALVTICSSPDGQLQYRGVRLSDDAALMLPATALTAGGFQAANGGVIYTISARDLVVTEGDTTLVRQPMLEYREPG